MNNKIDAPEVSPPVPALYGSKKMSYTAILNWKQCKYRLWLMSTEKRQSLLFPPMTRGLFWHKVMEHLANKVMGAIASNALLAEDFVITREDLPSFDELFEEAITPPAGRDIDFGGRRLIWYTDNGLDELKLEYNERIDEFISFVLGFFKAMYLTGWVLTGAEQKVRRLFHERWQFEGHLDLLFHNPHTNRFAFADLKTGREAKFSSQFIMYSYLINGLSDSEPTDCFVLLFPPIPNRHKIQRYRIRTDADDPSLQHILWGFASVQNKLQEIERRLAEEEIAPEALLPPNTKGFSCHEKRCSFFHVCPFGQAKQKQGGAKKDDETSGTAVE